MPLWVGRAGPRLSAAACLLALSACGNHGQSLVLPPPDQETSLRDGPPSLSVGATALAAGAPVIALSVAQDTLASNPANVTALVMAGDALYSLGRWPEATARYKEALAISPGERAAQLGLARIQLTSDPAGTEEMLMQLVAQDPHDARAQNDLGIARDLQGRHKEAQDAYRLAIQAAPDMVAAQVNLALSLSLTQGSGPAPRVIAPRPLAAAAE